jgi:[acyl-carrier-protein] S-malonyltransferase
MEAAAAAHGQGGMLALLGAEPEDAAAVAAEYELVVANDNAPGQVVLSGDREAIESLAGSARDRGFKALMLDVSGAFHSPAVDAARDPFFEALTAVEWTEPAVTVVSASTAAPFTDFPRELADAVVSPVRWRETMTALYDLGAREFVDAGPGKVVARLASRNLPTQEAHALAG